ncbi:MAG: hypothetical protein GY870_18700, partial [archaeon]|nr:hypothetical protein [archaeon]
NLRRLWVADATSGIRGFGRSTAFPSAVAMTASWNRDLIKVVGETIGEECRAKGVSILLGPGVNIYRVPTNGRNFEYMGEDPFLASEMSSSYIQGVQSKKIATTIKHFACNYSDHDRHRMNSVVSERALHEIYFPTFRKAVKKAGTKGIMCAYNLINGVHCSEDKWLLTDILRNKWNYDGFVISDWNSLYSTKYALLAGLDLEKPSGKFYNMKEINKLLLKEEITTEDINKPVKNLLKVFFEMGFYEKPFKDKEALEYGEKHDKIALKMAEEGIVLLKNEKNILPLELSSNKSKKIVVLGRNAHPTPTSGGGSCMVAPYKPKSIYEGLKDVVGDKADVELISIKKSEINEEDIDKIKLADYVVLCVGFTRLEDSEAWDRDWEMHNYQIELIKKTTKLNSKTILVFSSGGGTETESWINNVSTFLHTFYLGQCVGTAIANILLGLKNPSGKLPFTMAKKWEDFGTTKNYVENPSKISPRQMLGDKREKPQKNIINTNYEEGILVGYRHFDTNQITPQFPFGFGLSYTSFDYGNFQSMPEEITKEQSINISLDVTNTGKKTGKEIIQVYVRDIESSVLRPDKELKNFNKIELKPNETKTVEFS